MLTPLDQIINAKPHWQPIDEWVAQNKPKGVTFGKVLIAAQHDIHLPLWIPDRDRVLVDVNRTYEWFELVRLLDKMLDPDAPGTGQPTTRQAVAAKAAAATRKTGPPRQQQRAAP
jgi:hypothetical protein